MTHSPFLGEFETDPAVDDNDWTRPQVGEVSYRALEWSVAVPKTPGLYLMRQPGAPRVTWRVIEVWDHEGELVGGWTDLVRRPVEQFRPREFCRIQEPRA